MHLEGQSNSTNYHRRSSIASLSLRTPSKLLFGNHQARSRSRPRRKFVSHRISGSPDQLSATGQHGPTCPMLRGTRDSRNIRFSFRTRLRPRGTIRITRTPVPKDQRPAEPSKSSAPLLVIVSREAEGQSINFKLNRRPISGTTIQDVSDGPGGEIAYSNS